MTFQASPSGKLARRTLLRHALTAVFAIGLLAGIGDVARADDQSQANGLVQSATKSVRNFLVNPKWQAVRNLMGGARAIYIVPHDVQGGFLLTASGGQGVLLRRHGEVLERSGFSSYRSRGSGLRSGRRG